MTPSQLVGVSFDPTAGGRKTLSLNDTTVRIADVQSIVTPEFWASLVVDHNKAGKITGTSYSLMSIHGPRLNYYSGTYDASGSAVQLNNSATRYYLQTGDSGKLQRFSYKSMRSAVPTSSPASSYLASYRKHKTVNNTIRWTGFGIMIASIGLLALGIGLIAFPIGLGVLTAGGIMQSKNIKKRLHRAFYVHNGMKEL